MESSNYLTDSSDQTEISVSTLKDLINIRANEHPDRRTYTFLNYHQNDQIVEDSITNRELYDKAIIIAEDLIRNGAKTGDRALLLYLPGLEYICAFYGCILAGVVAVPAYPPLSGRILKRFETVITDSQARFFLSSSDLSEMIMPQIKHYKNDYEIIYCETDLLNGTPDESIRQKLKQISTTKDSLAFLQYTSGSTAAPKGVMITHGNLIHNSAMIYNAFEHHENSRGVIWLPPYHDMGLIGGILQFLYGNFPVILMSPMDFLQKPFRWLKAVSDYRATTSGGPNFAYDLCLKKISPEQRDSLDLSSWVNAFNGAEPVKFNTINNFINYFKPCGFSSKTFFPCYGIAEATLLVTGDKMNSDPVIKSFHNKDLMDKVVTQLPEGNEHARPLAGSGVILDDEQVEIVNPDSLVKLNHSMIGEIWVKSKSIAKGYWNNPKATDKTFNAYIKNTGEGPFLRTGDLGFISNDGELFVTGRLKDMIIIRGKNIYPQDIEQEAEIAHPSLRSGCCAAFSVETGGEPELALAIEIKKEFLSDFDIDSVGKQIHRNIIENFEQTVSSVLFLKPGTIPKTTSGKIQRHACRDMFNDEKSPRIGIWSGTGPSVEPDTIATAPATDMSDGFYTHSDMSDWIVNQIASTLKIPVASIDIFEPFTSYSLTSVDAIGLSGKLEEWLGDKIPPTVFFDYPNIYNLSLFLTGKNIIKQKSDTPVSHSHPNESIAIVGMACRFPGADNPEEFWELLIKGKNAVTKAPDNRWGANIQLNENHYSGGYLNDVDKFDAEFFGFSPREAVQTDPQQRLLLEVSWESLENAGIKPSSLAGTKTGVFFGISSNDYLQLQCKNSDITNVYAGTGNAFSIASNRLSYFLDLRGPSISLDTACSSSLVAIHQAGMSLRQNECDTAICGGVNLILSPDLTGVFAKAGMLSSEGICKTFDASADGYVRGEGCGVVVLKRLSDAKRDGNTILGVIKGSAVNQDGRSNGLTAPNGPAQEDVIRTALKNANVAPSQVCYVEAHGTGTSLGDPIEFNSLMNVISEERSTEDVCLVGSVKTNVGHLEAAAGVAGFIKTVLALRHSKIPQNLHYTLLNPYIDSTALLLSVPQAVEALPVNNKAKIAGISAFGFGGTNAHVVLEHEDVICTEHEIMTQHPKIIVLSAKNREVLNRYAVKLLNFIDISEKNNCRLNLDDIAYTLQTGREEMQERLAFTTRTIQETKEKLIHYIENNDRECDVYTGNSLAIGKNRISLEINGEPDDFFINHIARTWVNGGVIDWKGLYRLHKPRIAGLPTYPFAKDRYWIDQTFSEKQTGSQENQPEDEVSINELPEVQIELSGREDKDYTETELLVSRVFCTELELSAIDIDTTFSDMGVDSIIGTFAANTINDILNTEIDVSVILSLETIREVSGHIDSAVMNQPENDRMTDSLAPVSEKDYYPVSPAQNRLYILNRIDPESTHYNTPFSIEIEGLPDKEKIQTVFSEIIRRHESFRTTFFITDNEVVQKIHSEGVLDISFENTTPGMIEQTKNEFIRPFDLSKLPLVRIKLLTVEKERHIFLIDMNHVISDGTSMGILLNEFGMLYNDLALPEQTLHYKDYASWQKELLQNGAMDNQKAFWKTTLSGELPVLNLSPDFPRPPVQSFAGARTTVTISDTLLTEIGQLTKETGTTLYMFLLAAYNVLLLRYTGNDDIIVGSPVAGRLDSRLEKIVGVFVNTLPMRNRPTLTVSFRDFLGQVKEAVLNAFENQSFPFDAIVDQLDIKRDAGRNPLFDTMLTLQNEELTELNLQGLRFHPFKFENRASKFDISLDIIERNNELEVFIEYCTTLFKKETIDRFGNHFINCIQSILESPDIRLGDVELLSGDEKNNILSLFNFRNVDYPSGKTIHGIFEEQTEKTPDNTAVVFNDQELTYRHLNEKSNQLAHLLRREGVSPGVMTGVYTARSPETIIAILGILKAGGAYLPLDPDYPADRTEYILEDSNTEILLSTDDLADTIRFEKKTICIDIDNTAVYSGNTSNPEETNSPSDIAYVIYTSGTTGHPKGVMVEHTNAVRLFFNSEFQFDFNENDVWTMFHSPCFDFSVWEMYGALLYGGKLVIIPKTIARDPAEFLKIVKSEKVSVLNQTPSAFYNLIEEDLQSPKTDYNLNYIIFGGEALKAGKLKNWHERYPGIKLINMYGITETTVHVTYKEIGPNDIKNNRSNIGHPIPTLSTYILDQNRRIVPAGVPGELCVAGAGVSRGYLGKPELTSQRFIENPYQAGERMYCSGDLVRILNDHEMEYLDRIDNQIQLRGYRIELGEIENRLLEFNSVENAVVIDKKTPGDDTYLCAYIVSSTDITTSELRRHLSELLPDYMIPSCFVFLDDIPLTSNGKTDKQALPEPEKTLSNAYIAPETELEIRLADLWSEILGVDKVGIRDNFFELGGESLKAVRVANALRLDFQLSVNDIFICQTIEELAARLTDRKNDLMSRLNSIKRYYNELDRSQDQIFKEIESDYTEYLEKAEQDIAGIALSQTDTKKQILLTGATGYLGIHLLRKLLSDGNSVISVLIRGNNQQESETRLSELMTFYFGSSEFNKYKTRITILNGDLTQEKFGLPSDLYTHLKNHTDSIINCAANVKHYGDYSEFYKTNVESVKRLAEFARDGLDKELHHVSTTSVGWGKLDSTDHTLFTEYDSDINQEISNYYIKTKLEAETVIQEEIKNGLRASVYRVGNLTFDSNTGKFQKNIEDNGFYKTVNSLLTLKTVPDLTVNTMEFTYIDYACDAIALLFNQDGLINETHHIHNPNTISYSKFASLLNDLKIQVNTLPFNSFADFLFSNYDDPELEKPVQEFILHSYLLEIPENTNFITASDKTQILLKKLGFTWPEVTHDAVSKMINYGESVNFFKY